MNVGQVTHGPGGQSRAQSSSALRPIGKPIDHDAEPASVGDAGLRPNNKHTDLMGPRIDSTPLFRRRGRPGLDSKRLRCMLGLLSSRTLSLPEQDTPVVPCLTRCKRMSIRTTRMNKLKAFPTHSSCFIHGPVIISVRGSTTNRPVTNTPARGGGHFIKATGGNCKPADRNDHKLDRGQARRTLPPWDYLAIHWARVICYTQPGKIRRKMIRLEQREKLLWSFGLRTETSVVIESHQTWRGRRAQPSKSTNELTRSARLAGCEVSRVLAIKLNQGHGDGPANLLNSFQVWSIYVDVGQWTSRPGSDQARGHYITRDRSPLLWLAHTDYVAWPAWCSRQESVSKSVQRRRRSLQALHTFSMMMAGMATATILHRGAEDAVPARRVPPLRSSRGQQTGPVTVTRCQPIGQRVEWCDLCNTLDRVMTRRCGSGGENTHTAATDQSVSGVQNVVADRHHLGQYRMGLRHYGVQA
ncbi:hypothetical protein RRG08_057617 [Elysia crispata]|uniref:Uncharacterized protein n=1 Tax=Elysia crispata TaxID=231223 RepID=A0AAE1A1A5_9GAST|nr:hypothetical protein RRG08_057617 [Elysia crispata]